MFLLESSFQLKRCRLRLCWRSWNKYLRREWVSTFGKIRHENHYSDVLSGPNEKMEVAQFSCVGYSGLRARNNPKPKQLFWRGFSFSFPMIRQWWNAWRQPSPDETRDNSLEICDSFACIKIVNAKTISLWYCEASRNTPVMVLRCAMHDWRDPRQVNWKAMQVWKQARHTLRYGKHVLGWTMLALGWIMQNIFLLLICEARLFDPHQCIEMGSELT